MLLVGDDATSQEAAVGKPFIGLNGFYLDRLLKRAGIDRNTLALHNVLSCEPHCQVTQDAIDQCAPNLDITIRKQNPKAIVALGNTALRRLVPGADGIKRHRGFVRANAHGRWVVPTYHPSFLLPRDGQANTTRFVGVVIRDIRRALRIAAEGFSREPLVYSLDEGPTQLAMWIAEFEAAYARGEITFLSFDIETPYKLKTADEDDLQEEEDDEDDNGPPVAEPIIRIAFSYRPGHSITIPWNAEHLEGITFLLAHPAAKCVWNGVRFDVPVIESHGIRVAGRVYDFMWGFHVWQSDLPKSLEFAASLLTNLEPWKHLSNDEPAHYNAMDADAQLRCGLTLKTEMTASRQWDIFERHVVDLDPLLMAMGKRGVLIDKVAQDELRAHLEGERDRMMADAQILVPDELRPRKEYKKLPAIDDVQTWDVRDNRWYADGRMFEPRDTEADIKVCSHCGERVSNKTEHLKGGKKNNPCAAAGATLIKQAGQVVVYDEIEDFNPNSVQHLIKYAKFFNHPVPDNHKTGKESLDKKAVQRLAKTKGGKHPIYAVALKLRGVRKTLGTYVEGFTPDRDGLIHTTFGHHPSSLRLSSRNVNLQNVSHRGGVAFADWVRRTIVPRPGHVFVEADSSAIEAVMTGHFMGSAEYIARAKKGIHDYLNCVEHGWAFDADGIAQSKAPEFKQARDRHKITVHGTSYGMTPYLMHMSNPEIFPTVKSAEASQQIFFDACPGLKEWQHATRVFAHKQTYLENPWHYRHYFYDVFNGRDKAGNLTLGGDGNRCVSFLPQSSASAFLKDNLLMLAQSPFWPMPAIGVIHDSYCLEVLERDTDAAVALLVQILTRPIPEMNHLTIGCEVKVSVPDSHGVVHWNSMKTAA